MQAAPMLLYAGLYLPPLQRHVVSAFSRAGTAADASRAVGSRSYSPYCSQTCARVATFRPSAFIISSSSCPPCSSAWVCTVQAGADTAADAPPPVVPEALSSTLHRAAATNQPTAGRRMIIVYEGSAHVYTDVPADKVTCNLDYLENTRSMWHACMGHVHGHCEVHNVYEGSANVFTNVPADQVRRSLD